MTAPNPRTMALSARLLAALAAGAGVLLWALVAMASPSKGEMVADLARVASYLADYRNIPGVTEEEEKAIEALKSSGKILRFGTFRSGEAVINRHGVKGGFLISLAETISEMFGLEIRHEFVGRRELKEKLEKLELDLACEIPFSETNRETLAMTSPVFERLVKVYRRRGDAWTEELLESQQPSSGRPGIQKYGFLEGAGVAELVLADVRRPVETVIFDNYREAVERLLNGSLDAFFDEAPAALYFEVFASIESSSYYPPVNTQLSLATGQKELAAVISVFQKFLEAEGHDWLFEIYARSADDIRRIYFEDSLDLAQERLLARLKAQDAAIKVVAGSNDYPVTFWNKRDQAFEGIAHDVLDELAKVTGLRFEVINPPNTTDNQLKEMIYFGLADLMVNFNFFDDDSNEALLSAIPHNYDRYALLTTGSHAEIKFSQIAYEIVGLVPGDKYSDVYIRWFPNARNFKRYGSMSLALEALRQGQVDCLMASSNYLLNLTNYLEEPLFKAALVFDEEVPHGLAYGPSKAALRDLIDKAMGFVDLGPIQSRWYAKFFNYRHKFIKDSAPFLIGFCALLIISLTALIRVNARNRRLNQKLESMVSARTEQLLSTQKTLEREKLLMSSIVDTCPVSLVITHMGKILFLNPIAKRFLGKEAGDDWTGSFVEPGVLEEYRAILAAGSEVDWLPTKLKRADGRVRETLVNTFENDYYGEKAFISWITDVTELRDNAAELSLARDIAEDSARAKSEFLANMSHEIRTPMNAILGLTELALQTTLSETQRDYLEKTATAAKSLLGIINDILDFSKIEAGKLQMESIAFDLEDVLETAIGLFAFRARDKGLELLLKVEPMVRTDLLGDPLRLGQVLNNLLGNAMKFTEKGSVTLEVSLMEAAEGVADLIFEVKDTGIGLTPEQIERIFTAFNQADSSFTRRYGGTGLGLAISKRVVELMGGRIWAESETGIGSTFAFTAQFGLSDNPSVFLTPKEILKNKRALCFDDSPEALEVMSGYLRGLGLRAETASTLDELIEKALAAKADGQPFDLIAAEVLGQEDGEESLFKLIEEKFEPKGRPALVLVAEEGRLASGREAGAAPAVIKPVTPRGLLAAIEEALGGHGQGKSGKKRHLPGNGPGGGIENLKGSKILLAEDNEVNQLVASKILKNAGLSVDVANNGQEAVDLVLNGKYDLVLMDIQMPVMDGLTATKAIRGLPGGDKLPIVAMTAHAMTGDREQSLAVGMNDHITKPINLGELFGALSRWIEKP